MSASNARVVSLHSHPAWSAAHRREELRAEAMRRHPAYRYREELATRGKAELAVVHDINERRGGNAAVKAAGAAPGHSARHESVAETADSAASECALAQFTDAVVYPLLRPFVEFWYPIAVGCIENLPRLMPRNASADSAATTLQSAQKEPLPRA